MPSVAAPSIVATCRSPVIPGRPQDPGPHPFSWRPQQGARCSRSCASRRSPNRPAARPDRETVFASRERQLLRHAEWPCLCRRASSNTSNRYPAPLRGFPARRRDGEPDLEKSATASGCCLSPVCFNAPTAIKPSATAGGPTATVYWGLTFRWLSFPEAATMSAPRPVATLAAINCDKRSNRRTLPRYPSNARDVAMLRGIHASQSTPSRSRESPYPRTWR